MGKKDEPSDEMLGYLAGDKDMPRDEAIRKILGLKGDLCLAETTESCCSPMEAYMLILFLAPMMKGKATKRRFLDNALTAAVAREGFTKARSLVIDIAREWGFDLEKEKWSWGSMMAAAASFGRYDMVDRLLDLGVSPEGRKKHEALSMLLIESVGEESYVICMRLLLDAGAEIHKDWLTWDNIDGGIFRAAAEKRAMAKDRKIKPGNEKSGGKKIGKPRV